MPAGAATSKVESEAEGVLEDAVRPRRCLRVRPPHKPSKRVDTHRDAQCRAVPNPRIGEERAPVPMSAAVVYHDVVQSGTGAHTRRHQSIVRASSLTSPRTTTNNPPPGIARTTTRFAISVCRCTTQHQCRPAVPRNNPVRDHRPTPRSVCARACRQNVQTNATPTLQTTRDHHGAQEDC